MLKIKHCIGCDFFENNNNNNNNNIFVETLMKIINLVRVYNGRSERNERFGTAKSSGKKLDKTVRTNSRGRRYEAMQYMI